METQTTQQIDTHRFGESDYITADPFEENETIKVKVLDFLGRREYVARDTTKKRAAYYKVDDKGAAKEWRLGIKNEITLKKKFGVKSYEDLKGKWVTLVCKHYNLGNGFVITDVSAERKL